MRDSATGRFLQTAFKYVNGDTSSFGIYKITNSENGKFYIGSTCDSFENRWHKHLTDLRANRHSNRILQSAFKKYGENCLVFSIVMDMKGFNEEAVRKQEEKMLSELPPYNLSKNAFGTVTKISTEKSQKIIHDLLVEGNTLMGVAEKHGVGVKFCRKLITGRDKYRPVSKDVVDRYKILASERVAEASSRSNQKSKRKVVHIHTGMVFDCAAIAGKAFGISSSTVRDVIYGKRKGEPDFRHL